MARCVPFWCEGTDPVNHKELTNTFQICDECNTKYCKPNSNENVCVTLITIVYDLISGQA